MAHLRESTPTTGLIVSFAVSAALALCPGGLTARTGFVQMSRRALGTILPAEVSRHYAIGTGAPKGFSRLQVAVAVGLLVPRLRSLLCCRRAPEERQLKRGWVARDPSMAVKIN